MVNNALIPFGSEGNLALDSACSGVWDGRCLANARWWTQDGKSRMQMQAANDSGDMADARQLAQDVWDAVSLYIDVRDVDCCQAVMNLPMKQMLPWWYDWVQSRPRMQCGSS